MRILTVSDVESDLFYEYYRPGRLDGFDLIISCGDLKVSYLEFLVTMANCPLLYVHGNHDEHFKREPQGCICIDDKLFVYRGIRFVGLGGSYRYREGEYMFTENEMKRRILRLTPSIMRHHGFDVLVTHAPARGVNDLNTLPHRGFECFTELILRRKPKLFVHGHVHRNYELGIPQKSAFGNTEVVNAFEHCIIDL